MALTPKDYCSLHNHTVYSLLDGLNHIEKLVARAKDLGMDTLAITDHGRMCGALEFARECKKAGIKPIIGVEAYLAHRTVEEKQTPDNPTDHLLLLAQNETGFQNLSQMLSIAEAPPYFYQKPRLDMDLLAQYSEGVICSSACINGPIARHIVAPRFKERVKGQREWKTIQWDVNEKAAIEYAGKLKEIFGENFYLEVMYHPVDETRLVDVECIQHGKEAALMEWAFVERATRIAHAVGVPMIATNDCHFLDATQHPAHDVLLQINSFRSSKKGGAGGLRSGLDQLYFKSFEEMRALWSPNGERDDLLTNTRAIADSCTFEFKTGEFHLPYIDLGGQPDDMTLLKRQVLQGMDERYPGRPQEVINRIKYELSVIEKIGVAKYFLVVADFCQWARKQGILIGPGRGSGGGSVVVYCLGITDLCPLKHKLIFERFMNPDRVSMPDLDIDFEPSRRHEVIEYVRQKYGADCVAAIATFQRMKTRACIKRVGEVFEIPADELNELTKSLPQDQGDFRIDLKELRENNEDLKKFVRVDPERREKMLDICEALDQTISATSGHAAGIVIADKPIVEYIPTMVGSRERKEERWDAPRYTQVSMDDLEDLGLLKYDFLVIDYLDVIRTCINYIKRNKGEEFEFPPEKDFDYEDQKIFDLVSSGRTLGVFQIESEGMRNVCIRLAPHSFEDLYAILALHRPGPMDYVSESTGLTMEEEYIERRFGRVPISFDHDDFKPILEDTYGVMVYQEQLTAIAQQFCGYTYGQADKIRKAVGKKKPQQIAEEKEKWVPAAMAQGHSEELALHVWGQIETFGRYGFNRAHSAGYGKITYQTARLKAYYPVEYMAALLAIDGEDEIQVKKYVRDCMSQGIRVLPPDINESEPLAIPVGDEVRFGLRSIAGIKNCADTICQIRADEPFKNLSDFISRLHGTNVKYADVEKLIRAGCCDQWGRRLGLMKNAKDLWKLRDKNARRKVQSVPLFDIGDTVESTEAPVIREEDRIRAELELLSGCYREDVTTTREVHSTRVKIVCWDLEMTKRAAEIPNSYPGRTPLLAMCPTERRHAMWLQLGTVQNSTKVRQVLKDLGCKILE